MHGLETINAMNNRRSGLSTEAAARKDRTQPHAPNFQHRHFAEIARIVRELPPYARATAKYTFADELARTNPRFDRERFLAACEGGAD